MSSEPRRALSDEDTEQLVRELREHVRALNYATMGPPGLTLPGTAYTILGNLSEAQHGLIQALRQLDQFFAHELKGGRLGHDSGQAPHESIDEAQHMLGQAMILTKNLGRALGRAQSAIRFINARAATTIESDPCTTTVRTMIEDFPQPISEALGSPDRSPPPSPSPLRPDPPGGRRRPA